MNFNFFELLQINDATFPIGGYSFSWGLETFVQQGIISDSNSAESFILSELKSSFLYSELLTVRLAYEAENNQTLLQTLDEIYGASRSPFELRDGSKKLGTRFVKTTQSFNPSAVDEQTSFLCTYFPVAYGHYCFNRSIPLEEALSAFTYSQISARVTTCVKLVPLSQSEGQKILYSLMKEFNSLIEKCKKLDKSDLCRSSPGLDIRAMQHEYLYSRLYSN